MEMQKSPEFKLIFSKYCKSTSLAVQLANKLRLTTISQRGVRNSRAMMGTNPLSTENPWN
jgi:hypothetical protein